MKRQKLSLWFLCLCSALMLSLPWLVPGMGVFALFGFFPLLCAEYAAGKRGIKYFFPWHYSTFVLWNALTTFWVCNATVGGGIFAILANALQMSLIFGLFRVARRHLRGVLPYVFLAALWIAWERWYLVHAEISWPWLVLGNAFARTTKAVQWYSISGTLGGSLWIWLVNLGVFGLLVSATDGVRMRRARRSSTAEAAAVLLVSILPPICSGIMYDNYQERSEKQVDVLIAQPNIDPYHKFTALTQSQQTGLLLDLLKEPQSQKPAGLILAPETFTFDVILNDIPSSPTWQSFRDFLQDSPGTGFLFGASTNELFYSRSAPGLLSFPFGNGWRVSHNSALMLSPDGRTEVYHKSKLVVGTELTPYPKIFVPLDNWLCRYFNGGHPMMARDVGQDEISLMHMPDGTPFGCAVCYESVYGEYCAGYVRKGAGFLTVITNDSWWGNTPGYKQHLSYSCLRAIELRRDIARCGNSGISGFIDQRGDILQQGPWWEEAVLRGSVNVNGEQTFFARHGDMTGRLAGLVALLLAALLLVRVLLGRK